MACDVSLLRQFFLVGSGCKIGHKLGRLTILVSQIVQMGCRSGGDRIARLSLCSNVCDRSVAAVAGLLGTVGQSFVPTEVTRVLECVGSLMTQLCSRVSYLLGNLGQLIYLRLVLSLLLLPHLVGGLHTWSLLAAGCS